MVVCNYNNLQDEKPLADLSISNHNLTSNPKLVFPCPILSEWLWFVSYPTWDLHHVHFDWKGQNYGSLVDTLTKQNQCLGGGNSKIFFHPYYLGKWSKLTSAYFSSGFVQPPTSLLSFYCSIIHHCLVLAGQENGQLTLALFLTMLGP